MYLFKEGLVCSGTGRAAEQGSEADAAAISGAMVKIDQVTHRDLQTQGLRRLFLFVHATDYDDPSDRFQHPFVYGFYR